MEYQIVKRFNEASGEIEYTVQKKDRVLNFFYGEPKYYWRDMKGFELIGEARLYMETAKRCKEEVVK